MLKKQALMEFNYKLLMGFWWMVSFLTLLIRGLMIMEDRYKIDLAFV